MLKTKKEGILEASIKMEMVSEKIYRKNNKIPPICEINRPL
jgi:hypothetical protein